MNRMTITTEYGEHVNTDINGEPCGVTSWHTYFMPGAPGGEVEPFFVSEAWCRLQDNYGLSSVQADTLLAIAVDHGRVDLAY